MSHPTLLPDLDKLLELADDASLLAYRDALAALCSRGTRPVRSAKGFELKDATTVLSVSYPQYASYDATLAAVKADVQKELLNANKAEFLCLLNPDSGRQGFQQAERRARTALLRYHNLLMYKHVLDLVRPIAAEEALAGRLASTQDAYTEALQHFKDATDDATQGARVKDAVKARKLFGAVRSADHANDNHANASSAAAANDTMRGDVLVEKLPVVLNETTQRRIKREKVLERNTKIAVKMQRQQERKKQQRKQKTTNK